jgi:radical SAM superfamily enzyme YgiQ (UPF0313 family)
MSRKTLLIKLKEYRFDDAKPVLTPPWGLWSIRANAKDITVVDENLPGHIGNYFYDLIGFSLSYASQERNFPELRSRCHAKHFLVGGPHGGTLNVPHHEPVRGPGEDYFLGYHIEFEALAFPEPAEKDMLPYWSAGAPFGEVPADVRWLPLETSRGCPYACNFCGMPDFWGHWSARSPEVLEDHVYYMSERLGVKHFIILDDNISLRKSRFLAIIEMFNKHGLTWSAPNGIYARALLDPDVSEALRDSTCTALSFPFECATAHSAELMNLGKKHLNVSEAIALLARFFGSTIRLTGFFVIGYPGETEEDVKRTLAMANILPLHERYIYFATPYPGTRLANHAKGYLVESPYPATYKNPVIDTAELPKEKLLELWSEDRKRALKRKENR